MVFGKIFGGLFGGGGEKRASSVEFPPVDYKGFTIVPAPTQRNGQWQVAGRIFREGPDGERREHSFIRADQVPGRDEAAEFSLRKAKQIIDEQGERIFA
ncbi:MAG: transcriptional regulator [Rhodobacteraceae bacterium]|nr:transcriptional regulator [Paracoccaceae bacterium]